MWSFLDKSFSDFGGDFIYVAESREKILFKKIIKLALFVSNKIERNVFSLKKISFLTSRESEIKKNPLMWLSDRIMLQWYKTTRL